MTEGPYLREIARELASEHGENPEYDRALVEMVMRAEGLTEDDRATVIAAITNNPYQEN